MNTKITEIIPEGIFNDPDLKKAFDEGQLFSTMLERIKRLEAELKELRDEPTAFELGAAIRNSGLEGAT